MCLRGGIEDFGFKERITKREEKNQKGDQNLLLTVDTVQMRGQIFCPLLTGSLDMTKLS